MKNLFLKIFIVLSLVVFGVINCASQETTSCTYGTGDNEICLNYQSGEKASFKSDCELISNYKYSETEACKNSNYKNKCTDISSSKDGKSWVYTAFTKITSAESVCTEKKGKWSTTP